MTTTADNNAQTFTGRSSREVYARIRAQLGADAVILEQRSDDGVVTVKACRDFPDSTVAMEASSEVFQRRLMELGFPADFISRLPPALSWAQVKDVISDTVVVESPPRRLLGSYRFVGAPGVGKTTSIIKLLAEQVLNFGPQSCVAVSTDLRRLAGSEQLALAAELLGVDFLEVMPQRLEESLSELGERDLVLIDTAGISVNAGSYQPASCPDIVVLPATWRAGALRRTTIQLPAERAAGVVVSQIDQSDSLAEVATVLAELRIPLRWCSDSPDLYDDLKAMSRQILRDLLFPEIDRSQISTTFA